MGGLNENENLILIEDEDETNWNEMKIEKYVERVESGNVQTKNSKVEKNTELIMIFFVGFTCWKKNL